MRIKITFLRAKDSTSSVPLHHQRLVSSFIEYIINELKEKPKSYHFSTLKGTSKVQNGFVKFLSNKVSVVISSSDAAFVEAFGQKVMEKKTIHIGKLLLHPKNVQIIDEPEFSMQMKYVCISPVILFNPAQGSEHIDSIYNPASHEFSDLLYHAAIDKMELLGVSEEQLNQYAEFGAVPDSTYMNKLTGDGKKYARQYKSNEDITLQGYLLPFMLHAHPEVHQFIWNNGLGVLNEQGYGMLDLAKDEKIESTED